MSTPPRFWYRNNCLSLENCTFVTEAIQELIQEGKISEVNSSDLSNITLLSVSIQPRGKKRLILDLRLINQHLYKLNVLPFGLSSAPYIFTKLFRPLVKYWRSRDFHSMVYLNDGFDIEVSFERADYASHDIKGDLCASGFVINEGKSNYPPPPHPPGWIHIRKIDWFGISVFLGIANKVHRRIFKASSIIDILSKLSVSARFWSSFVGSIMSTSPVVTILASIMTRHGQISLAASPDWDTEFYLNEFCLAEVNFWRGNLTAINTRQFFKPILSHRKIVYSDVRSYACGALIKGTEQIVSHTTFSVQERSLSSTRREILTIYTVYKPLTSNFSTVA